MRNAEKTYSIKTGEGKCGADAMSNCLAALGIKNINTTELYKPGPPPSIEQLQRVANMHGVAMMECKDPKVIHAYAYIHAYALRPQPYIHAHALRPQP
jgi:hypothetical protein